jgi:dTDP-4-amino-4,6-dideoxygalactose transaminase
MQKFDVPYIALSTRAGNLKTELMTAYERVLDSGYYILSEEVREFEKCFATYTGSSHAIGVGSGTGALHLILMALGIGKNDEVITVPNSFVATAAVIALVGARPVFVDINKDLNMNPSNIESAITHRTKAIMPVHLTGRPANMSAIMEIAERHGLMVVEDAAQAVGAKWENRPVGSFGVANAFSCHPLKNLHAIGDAGVITTNDTDLAIKLRMARNHGLKNRTQCDFWSINCRLDEVHAASLNVMMPHIDIWAEKRRSLAQIYNSELKEVMCQKARNCAAKSMQNCPSYSCVPEEKAGEHHIYQTFVIQTKKRDALQAYLRENGIEALVHYPTLIHQQPAAENLGYRTDEFPIAQQLANQILSLPLYPELLESQQDKVIHFIKQFFK